MASPTILLNNLVKEEGNCYIDVVSKAYLWMEVLLGLNRLVLSLKIKPIFVLLASAYSIFCCAIVFYDVFFFYPLFIDHLDIGLDSMHYLFGVILSSIVWKRLQHYYLKLQDFDTTIGCRPKISSSSVKNLISMCIAVSLSILVVPYEWYIFDKLAGSLMLLPVRLLFLIDIHFYGHLLSLLVPRLRLINYYMKMSLSHHNKVVAPKIDELTFKSVILESQNCQMKKLMDLYCMIINAYDILIDAIKWQFVMVLTALFISILSFSYTTALMVIRSEPDADFDDEIAEITDAATTAPADGSPKPAPGRTFSPIPREAQLRLTPLEKLDRDCILVAWRRGWRPTSGCKGTPWEDAKSRRPQTRDSAPDQEPPRSLHPALKRPPPATQLAPKPQCRAPKPLSLSLGRDMRDLGPAPATRPFYNVAIESAFNCIRLFPLFAPCVFADQIQEEVRRLRELLASRLYENKLNKPSRSVARALLSLTEARDLSFSLLQIFDIDISLPFKFMGLLLTYLIILLQFEKVINP
ncbi:uncharacterized protein LOC133526626 [Cydia pomonella]|uniref:uncharacterized protein LOC133526626 n=1 Tax=Cydia pomonella TaxID=82600 RepID=UPI002ADD44C0|nr:uncharacterized protein LOC133526626 [Cydia pomonella]